MSPIAQALYFGAVMHASGIIVGWYCYKWLQKIDKK